MHEVLAESAGECHVVLDRPIAAAPLESSPDVGRERRGPRAQRFDDGDARSSSASVVARTENSSSRLFGDDVDRLPPSAMYAVHADAVAHVDALASRRDETFPCTP